MPAAINGVPADEHIGKTVDQVLPEMSDTILPYLRSVLMTGTPILGIEMVGRTPANREAVHDYLVSYYPVRGRDGTMLGVGVVVVDIWGAMR